MIAALVRLTSTNPPFFLTLPLSVLALALEEEKHLLPWKGSGAPTGADGTPSVLLIDRYDVRALLSDYSQFAELAEFDSTQHLQYVWAEELGRTEAERRAQGREALVIEEEGHDRTAQETEVERTERWRKRAALLNTVLDEERYRDLPADQDHTQPLSDEHISAEFDDGNATPTLPPSPHLLLACVSARSWQRLALSGLRGRKCRVTGVQ
jgi:hypothetical protein